MLKYKYEKFLQETKTTHIEYTIPSAQAILHYNHVYPMTEFMHKKKHI
jgi:hypothetical protein